MMRKVGRPGHGKWRLKGRGGRLKCWRYHNGGWPCRVCGVQTYGVFVGYGWDALLTSQKSGVLPEVEIGFIEKIRFIDAVMA